MRIKPTWLTASDLACSPSHLSEGAQHIPDPFPSTLPSLGMPGSGHQLWPALKLVLACRLAEDVCSGWFKDSMHICDMLISKGQQTQRGQRAQYASRPACSACARDADHGILFSNTECSCAPGMHRPAWQGRWGGTGRPVRAARPPRGTRRRAARAWLGAAAAPVQARRWRPGRAGAHAAPPRPCHCSPGCCPRLAHRMLRSAHHRVRVAGSTSWLCLTHREQGCLRCMQTAGHGLQAYNGQWPWNSQLFRLAKALNS